MDHAGDSGGGPGDGRHRNQRLGQGSHSLRHSCARHWLQSGPERERGVRVAGSQQPDRDAQHLPGAGAGHPGRHFRGFHNHIVWSKLGIKKQAGLNPQFVILNTWETIPGSRISTCRWPIDLLPHFFDLGCPSDLRMARDHFNKFPAAKYDLKAN